MYRTLSVLSVVLLFVVAASGARAGSTQPIQHWAAAYDSGSHRLDEARGVVVTGDGSVCVTGRSRSAAGDWDFNTVKYDGHGVLLWARRFDGPGHVDDDPVGIGADAQGNVYVAGIVGSASADEELAVVKYDPAGTVLWTALQGSPGVDFVAAALLVDPAGHTTLTGSIGVRGQRRDFLTTRFDAGGQQIWTQQYNGPGGEDDAAFAIAGDSTGNIYVTGYSLNADGPTLYYSDWPTVKYSPDGQLAWAARFQNPGRRFAEGISVQVDGDGNVYSSGTVEEPTHANELAALLKYDSHGNLLWEQTFGGTVGTSGGLVALDGAGNVYQEASRANFPPTILSYDANGGTRWNGAFAGLAGGYNSHSLFVDGQGLLYQALTFAAAPDYHENFLLLAYDLNGTPLWSSTVGDARYSKYDLAGFAMDGEGNLYLSGTAASANSAGHVIEDWFTQKLGGPANGLSGRVRQEDGTPLAGVVIQVADRTAVTDADGNYFVAELPAGNYTVTASLADYGFTPAAISVAVGPGNALADFLGRPLRYSLRVTIRSGGKPLAGLYVDLGFGEYITTGADGSYTITGLRAGSYRVSPNAFLWVFTPKTQSVTVGPSDGAADFDAVLYTASISGRIATSSGAGVAGVTVTAGTATAVTDAQGNYTLPGLAPGSYTVTPSRSGATFNPQSVSIRVGPDASSVNFVAQQSTFRISGTVRVNGAGTAGVTVKAGTRTAITGVDGAYVLDGLRPGRYTVQASRKKVTFTPKNRRIVLGPDASAVDFAGQAR